MTAVGRLAPIAPRVPTSCRTPVSAMVDQKIESPTESDIDAIARALIHAEHVVREALGSQLDSTRNDLGLIQRLLDSGAVERDATYTLQALGLAFGKVFLHENSDYDWWMVEDEYGRDPAVRYKLSNLLAHPSTMLSKRVEDGESVDVVALFDGLCRRMRAAYLNCLLDATTDRIRYLAGYAEEIAPDATICQTDKEKCYLSFVPPSFRVPIDTKDDSN
jgi:hypothetical protein